MRARSTPDRFWLSDGLVYLAKGLWQIRPDPRWLAAMIDVLASGDGWTRRQTAAETLYGVCDHAAAQALIKELDDADSLVLCVPKTLSALMTPRNHLSWRNDLAPVFHRGGLGLTIQVEDPA
jgi:hypothetical protein